MTRSHLYKAFTLISKDSQAILSYLSSTAISRSFPNSIVAFALSTNTDQVQRIVNELQALSESHIGCLSSPLPAAPSDTVCSVAIFPKNTCRVVRSTIPGRKQVQVGRWHVPNSLENHPSLEDQAPVLPADGDWSNLWSKAHSTESSYEIAGLDDADTLLFFSDNAPEGLIPAIDEQMSQAASKFGLVASATPFVTGRPFTLFHNSEILSAGGVGIAMRGQVKPQGHVLFEGFSGIAPPMLVTDAQANLIYKLDRDNPTRLLLSSINSSGRTHSSQAAESLFVTKSADFYLGVLYGDRAGFEAAKYQRVYRITSGDPSRGTMSLDAEDGPSAGTWVQFLRPFNPPPGESRSLLATAGAAPNLSFQFQSTCDEVQDTSHGTAQGLRVIQNVFLAASEHGFICNFREGMPFGRGRSWRSSVVGGSAIMTMA